MENVLQKEIQITNLKPIQRGQYNIGNVHANDGKVYDTFNMEWFNQRRVGETLIIKYYVKTKQGNTGRIYENNILVTPENQNNNNSTVTPGGNGQPTPSATPVNNAEVMNALRKLYSLVKEVESNILARLEFVPTEVKDIPVEVQVDKFPDTTEEEPTYIPVDENNQVKDAPPDGLPF